MTNLILLDDPNRAGASSELHPHTIPFDDGDPSGSAARKLKRWASDQNLNNAALLAALPPITSRLGQVATGTHVCSTFNTTSKQQMSKSGHFARDNLSSIALVFTNFYVATGVAGVETALGSNPATIDAVIEYPVGVFTDVTFGGVVGGGSVPAGGMQVSDFTAVSIPVGAQFWIRSWYNNPDGIVTLPYGNGTQSNEGVTVTNLCRTAGTITANTFHYPCSAIIGMTTKPCVALVGDSRFVGAGETFNAAYYFRGHIERMLAPAYPILNVAVFADRVQWASVNYTNRSALLAYATHILCGYGINDLIAGGQSAANTLTRLQTLYGLTGLTGKPIWQTTLEPQSTSTDVFVTETNQTTVANNGPRVTFNTTSRAALAANLVGLIDHSLFYEESQTTSGVWQAPGGVAITSDGVHLNTFGCVRIAAQGQIPGPFTR